MLFAAARSAAANNILHTDNYLGTLYYMLEITVLRSWGWANNCPKHVELIWRSINFYCCIYLVNYFIYENIRSHTSGIHRRIFEVFALLGCQRAERRHRSSIFEINTFLLLHLFGHVLYLGEYSVSYFRYPPTCFCGLCSSGVSDGRAKASQSYLLKKKYLFIIYLSPANLIKSLLLCEGLVWIVCLLVRKV